MLGVYTSVCRGVIFINLEGDLNEKSFIELEQSINYLLYKQKMHYFVIDFRNVSHLDMNIFNLIQNKVVEIFLSCGKVILSGIKNMSFKNCCYRDNIIIDNYMEAINYFYI